MLLRWIASEKQLANLNLSFAKKLDLFAGLEDPAMRWEPEIGHLRELNRIRNKLAHELTADQAHHKDLKKWACAVVGYKPKSLNRHRTYRNTVLKAFYLLTGTLSGRNETAMIHAQLERSKSRR